jgi:cation transport regulator
MPYSATHELPRPIQDRLPQHAQEIYLAAFNNAWKSYAGRDPKPLEETAHRIAWAAVKRKFRKDGDHWVPR